MLLIKQQIHSLVLVHLPFVVLDHHFLLNMTSITTLWVISPLVISSSKSRRRCVSLLASI